MSYPSTLARLQTIFGRDYTQLSRIFKFTTALVYELHKDKVNGNIGWYSERFDDYNEAIRAKIASLLINPNLGEVPDQLNDVFAFIDATAKEISRLTVIFSPNFWECFVFSLFIIMTDFLL